LGSPLTSWGLGLAVRSPVGGGLGGSLGCRGRVRRSARRGSPPAATCAFALFDSGGWVVGADRGAITMWGILVGQAGRRWSGAIVMAWGFGRGGLQAEVGGAVEVQDGAGGELCVWGG
jgi:hypothetical protein